jgi:hypothetical protein
MNGSKANRKIRAFRLFRGIRVKGFSTLLQPQEPAHFEWLQVAQW